MKKYIHFTSKDKENDLFNSTYLLLRNGSHKTIYLMLETEIINLKVLADAFIFLVNNENDVHISNRICIHKETLFLIIDLLDENVLSNILTRYLCTVHKDEKICFDMINEFISRGAKILGNDQELWYIPDEIFFALEIPNIIQSPCQTVEHNIMLKDTCTEAKKSCIKQFSTNNGSNFVMLMYLMVKNKEDINYYFNKCNGLNMESKINGFFGALLYYGINKHELINNCTLLGIEQFDFNESILLFIFAHDNNLEIKYIRQLLHEKVKELLNEILPLEQIDEMGAQILIQKKLATDTNKQSTTHYRFNKSFTKAILVPRTPKDAMNDPRFMELCNELKKLIN